MEIIETLGCHDWNKAPFHSGMEFCTFSSVGHSQLRLAPTVAVMSSWVTWGT